MEERLERQARNEALVREVNERINALDRDAAGSGAVEGVESFRFHCECGREGGCPEQIWMTLEEYEVVRKQDDRFALVPGHETDGLEHVVDGNERFVIVTRSTRPSRTGRRSSQLNLVNRQCLRSFSMLDRRSRLSVTALSVPVPPSRRSAPGPPFSWSLPCRPAAVVAAEAERSCRCRRGRRSRRRARCR